MFDRSYLMDTQPVSYYHIVEYVCSYVVMYVYSPTYVMRVLLQMLNKVQCNLILTFIVQSWG